LRPVCSFSATPPRQRNNFKISKSSGVVLVGNDLLGLFDDIVVPLIPHTINAMCFYEKKARLLNNLCFINSSALFYEKIY
jgi:hypothetical protein